MHCPNIVFQILTYTYLLVRTSLNSCYLTPAFLLPHTSCKTLFKTWPKAFYCAMAVRPSAVQRSRKVGIYTRPCLSALHVSLLPTSTEETKSFSKHRQKLCDRPRERGDRQESDKACLSGTAREHFGVVSAPGEMSHMVGVPPQYMLHFGLPVC